MKWTRSGRSEHLEDRRGTGGGVATAGKIGVPSILLLLLALFFGPDILGGNGFPVDNSGLGGAEPIPADQGGPGSLDQAPDPDAELVDFVSFVLDDTQATWDELFRSAGRTYQPANLVVYEEGTSTGCGFGTAAVGPFYCPADQRVYLDLAFFRDLRDRFDAPGDFAQAYVIAHEIGHHVQNLVGTSDQVRNLQQRTPDQANQLSVLLELQADCYAGVWAHATFERDILESGDLDEGLAAAASVGDDRIQRQATGRVNPESWTHGSSEQRVTWFRRGFDAGAPDQCNSFGG